MIANHESEVEEVLRGPIQTWMAEEAPQRAEEAEERKKLKAEDLNAELHEAVRQQRDQCTPYEEA